MKNIVIITIMKLQLTLLLVIFSTSIMYSQEFSRKIKVGFSAMPQFSITHFNPGHLVENQNSFSYTTGIDLYFPLSSKVQFITGLEFFGVHLKHRDYSPLFPSDVQNGQADIYKSYYDFASSYNFIGVPVEVKWNSGSEEKHFFLMTGLKPRLRLNQRGNVWLVESGGNPTPIRANEFFPEVEQMQLSFSVNAGYGWKSKKILHYSIGPLFEYAFTRVFDPASMTVANGHLSTIGLRFAFFR